ncbi:MAG: Abi family protein [Bacilli bacterium]|nr:Abi family protein [Bacilli bacterium]
MEKHSNNILIKNLELKNISFEGCKKTLFNRYSYYQVINAYKSLFVSETENINDIYENINNNEKIEDYKKMYCINSNIDIFREICKKICKKYGLEYNNTMKDTTLIKNISKIKYVHHIYHVGTKYKDFVRMYKFEHELRLLLLKYTLIIEENVKNIFVSYLNNCSDVKANFLSDGNNYNTSHGNNESLDTLKLILDKQKNIHSKPIQRKREQDITIPYWILINELAMNQTYKVIKNLKPQLSFEIFESCMNNLTNMKCTIKEIPKKDVQKHKGYVQSFKNLLKYIGEFRNMLAHNQPIFCYNHSNCDLTQFPKISYEVPYISSNRRKEEKMTAEDILHEQQKINSVTMYDLIKFFGKDDFNTKNYGRNIDLSFIIYVIYKIISTIDRNSHMYDELISLFKKYNMLISYNEKVIENNETVDKLIKQIGQMDENSIDFDGLIYKIENGKGYKRELSTFIKNYREEIIKLKKLSNQISYKKLVSKYDNFSAIERYEEYTGINARFFTIIK